MSVESAANLRDVSRDLFSATIGSICCCYTGQPLDTVKVRMQTNPAVYNGIMQTVTRTIQAEGGTALWKGAVPTAMGMVAENGMAFGVNEFLKRSFPDPNADSNLNTRPSMLRPFVMGLFTGCCSALVLLPSEVIKVNIKSISFCAIF